MLANKLMSAALSGGAEEKLYVDDVFSTYLYTGNGTTQTINNGIDLAGKGGLVWIKSRSNADPHYLQDSARSNFGQSLTARSSTAQFATTYITSVTSAGYSVSGNTNLSDQSTVAWTFRKAPKFFDVVTYTGNGAAGRRIPHGLGVAPGMMLVKGVSGTYPGYSWHIYHRSPGATKFGELNKTEPFYVSAGRWNNSESTATEFTLGGSLTVNGVGTQYVAYLFAHDDSEDGIVQCGSFTSTAAGLIPPVTLGWEPQFLLLKSSGATGNWTLIDSSRGFSDGGINQALYPNLSNAEAGNNAAKPTATGFDSNGGGGWGASVAGIYLAIRRPNKPPPSGTQVFSPQTGTGVKATGFPVDMQISANRSGGNYNAVVFARLRGVSTTPTIVSSPWLLTNSTAEENTGAVGTQYWRSDGYTAVNGSTYVDWNFRRAPGFFDVVCYTGDASSNKYIPHSLGAVPELVIVKRRSSASQWYVSHKDFGGTTYNAYLNLTNTKSRDHEFSTNDSPHSASAFIVSGGNTNSGNNVAYLFASLPGISKVGSYTGNGSNQTIDCGFTTGARFILIKRTDSNGDWYVWDTARGIVSANDPHLSLNTTAAEVTTDDSVDPAASGFIVNQVAATNINVNNGQYIFLAIA